MMKNDEICKYRFRVLTDHNHIQNLTAQKAPIFNKIKYDIIIL